jgi:hypothetical protein
LIRTELPPGCSSLRMEDGSVYPSETGRPGGFVNVEEHHAAAINHLPGNGDAGLVAAKGRHFLGTKDGRWCTACRRLWQCWSVVCPRCGEATEPEDS